MGFDSKLYKKFDGTMGIVYMILTTDKGVITFTATLSSFPYTPEKSAKFLDYLYDNSNGEYLGLAGPYDSFLYIINGRQKDI